MRLRPELLLCVALACAPATRGPAAPAVPPPLPLDSEEVALFARLLAMQDGRVLDTAVVARALSAPRVAVRVQAALAAGRTGDTAAAAALRAATRDSAPDVAAAAAFMLGELGDTSTATVSTLAELAGRIGWSRPAVAAEAVHALGKIGGALGRAALWPALTNDAPAPVLHEALLAIWRFERTAYSVEAVQAHLGDADAETRWRAAYALMRMASPASVEALQHALADTAHRVRAQAARGLRAAPVDSAGRREPTRTALRAALADPHAHVVINAARALASYGDSSDVAPIALLLGSANGHVASAAAAALGELGSAAAPPLHALAADASAPLTLRATALAALAHVDAQAARATADDWSQSGVWLQRFYAARALGGASWAVAEPLLAQLARDADPRVAAEALTAIAASADTLPGGYAFFVAGLGASDVMVRAAAARGLGQRPQPMDLPLLLQAYERASADTLKDAALAAVEALGALRAAGVPVERAFFVRFDPTTDPIVRRTVTEVLGGEWGIGRALASGRSAVDYAQLVRTLVAPVLAGEPGPHVRVTTGKGEIVLELDPVAAPLTVANFLDLVRTGFYASPNLRWHRVVPNFVLQAGDTRGDGNGGPAHTIRDEANRERYERGTLGMAHAGPDTGGSQFFITHSPQPHLDGGYTVFGRVIEGMAIADAVLQDDPILALEVVQ